MGSPGCRAKKKAGPEIPAPHILIRLFNSMNLSLLSILKILAEATDHVNLRISERLRIEEGAAKRYEQYVDNIEQGIAKFMKQVPRIHQDLLPEQVWFVVPLNDFGRQGDESVIIFRILRAGAAIAYQARTVGASDWISPSGAPYSKRGVLLRGMSIQELGQYAQYLAQNPRERKVPWDAFKKGTAQVQPLA